MRRPLHLALALLLAAPLSGKEPPQPFALLDQLRTAYGSAGASAEELSLAVGDAASPHLFARLRTAPPALYRLDLCTTRACDPPLQTIWRGEDGAVGVRAGDVVSTPPSLAAALLLHLEPDLAMALLLARLRAGDLAALPEPIAAAVDGPAPCPEAGARRCWVLSLTGEAAGEEHELWIDTASGELRQVRFTRPTVASVLAAPPPATPRTVEVVATVHPSPAAATLPFLPGPALAPGIPAPPSGDPSPAANTAFEAELEVRLATLLVRAVEPDGTPIAGLGPEDFELEIGHQEVAVAAVDWLSGDGPSLSGLPLAELARQGITLDPGGRLVVFFVQAGLETIRLKGHRRMLHQAGTLVEGLGVEDRAAVVSFDSHLKLRLDFTRQLGLVAEQLERAILFSRPPPLAPGPFPSLARHADLDEWKRAASPERALELVGMALEPLPGEKLVVFLGWGLGRYTSTGVHLYGRYDRAAQALRRANATVYVLDITDADFHSLEVGLRQVAADTGGVYEKTNHFPSQVAGRFARALGGAYLLSFVPPPAGGRVELSLRRGGRILTVSPPRIDASASPPGSRPR